MLDAVPLIVFSIVPFRLIRALSRQSSLLAEFGQSNGLSFAVALFPLGLFFMLLSAALPLPSAFVGALACYTPALVLARKRERVLQRAGTDRVNPARKVVEMSFGAALAGLLYVVVSIVLTLGVLSIKSVG